MKPRPTTGVILMGGRTTELLNRLVAGTRRSSMPYLDGLRGLAVLAVVIGHYTIVYPTLSSRISGLGANGVALFFVLSSFLLTGLLLRALERGPFVKQLAAYAAR